MMQFGKILELTQLNLVQPAAQGYTSAINETKGSNKKSAHQSGAVIHLNEAQINALNLQQTPTKGHLRVVAVQPISSGNREIDHELVLRAQRGDKRAFGLLVDKYQRKLARLLSRMVRDQSEIEDIVQESFIKAYRALPNFRGDSAFYTWLYRIGINTAKNYLVAMGRRPTVGTGVEIEDAENFEDGDELRTTDTPESAMAVSYTHLDVYKRQLLMIPQHRYCLHGRYGRCDARSLQARWAIQNSPLAATGQYPSRVQRCRWPPIRASCHL